MPARGTTQQQTSMLPATQPAASVLEHYPGAKSNSGIQQWLINRIPQHHVYAELFAGSAQLYAAKRPATQSFLVDKNPAVIAALQQLYPATYTRKPALEYECTDAVKFLRRWTIAPMRRAFIYLDPPYPFISRRGQRPLYTFEMLDADHVQLLATVREVDANIMISTRQNELYDQALHDWRKEEFKTVDRAGACTEIIYMNYPPPQFLHQYDYLGEGYIDRQRIKRKIDRFAGKLADLPTYEKHRFIQQLIDNDPAAVQHFLSVAKGITQFNI